MMTDPIADMLTRIRNANTMRHETVEVPTSTVKTAILNVLKNEGFIADFTVSADVKSVTTVTLKYNENRQRVIKGLKRISKPSLPVYTIAIISTSKGVMTDKEARKLKIGGEVLAYVW